MKSKSAYLIINPRSAKIDKVTALISVFSAAGWKTDTAIKEYSGHTRRLAKKAAKAGYDLVIGYGGDGTINQVINGVVDAKRPRCIVGVIPGGTANVWAHEIGMTEDPVKAALVLINSTGRKVDLGHVQVDPRPVSRRAPSRQSKQPLETGGRRHFLLMSGLGIDAAILRGVSTPLKEKIGEAAVAVATLAVAPTQHTFPIEIRAAAVGKQKSVHWKGEALQVIVGNTRRYGNIVEVTPEAYIDDGVLDVCVITAGDPLSTAQQILSVLLRRDPVHGRSEYFQSATVEISAPASIDLQLDGSPVNRKDFRVTTTRNKGASAAATVTYRFDALPRALQVAIPTSYRGPLFETGAANGDAPAGVDSLPGVDAAAGDAAEPAKVRRPRARLVREWINSGRKVTVVGVGRHPEDDEVYIVAGNAPAKKTGAPKPVAVRVDSSTALFTQGGKPLPTTFAATLPDGVVIVVDGKQSKRGVIKAKRIVVMR